MWFRPRTEMREILKFGWIFVGHMIIVSEFFILDGFLLAFLKMRMYYINRDRYEESA
jgi:hypothetical protein